MPQPTNVSQARGLALKFSQLRDQMEQLPDLPPGMGVAMKALIDSVDSFIDGKERPGPPGPP